MGIWCSNLIRFLSGNSEVDMHVVAGMAGGGVGNIGIVGTLKVDVIGQTLFLGPIVVLLRGNISLGSDGTVVAGDDVSVGVQVISGGAIGET
jgi:hypothetical protein